MWQKWHGKKCQILTVLLATASLSIFENTFCQFPVPICPISKIRDWNGQISNFTWAVMKKCNVFWNLWKCKLTQKKLKNPHKVWGKKFHRIPRKPCPVITKVIWCQAGDPGHVFIYICFHFYLYTLTWYTKLYSYVLHA